MKNIGNKSSSMLLLSILIVTLSACVVWSSGLDPTLESTNENKTAFQATTLEKPIQLSPTIQDSSLSTPSPDPSIRAETKLAITFVALQQSGSPGIFSVLLECPDENPPCIGEPQLLFADRLIDGLSKISWSPRGERVIFDSRPGPNLYISSADGSDVDNLTEALPKGISPSWAPDGSQITYTSCQNQPCRIYSIDINEFTFNTLLEKASTYGGINAVWDADSLKLAFNAYPNENLDTMHIFVSNPDGSDLIQVTDGDTDSYFPSISPDGKKVVYMSSFDLTKGQRLYISDLQGNEHILVDNPEGSVFAPAWSPSNGWIAFKQRTSDGVDDLFIVREDGSNLYQITFTPDVSEGAPAWRVYSPND